MTSSKKLTTIAILGARAISAAIITGHALGYPIPIVGLQIAELVTVCINTALLVLAVGLLVIVASHALLSTRLIKPPPKRTQLQTIIFGMVFALELAAFALVGGWFTLGLRVTSYVIVKATPYEGARA